ncbi:MAG: DUF3365 domain-containing protein [Candidatus Marinimicrobia bacterium]|nr:DUF3365 domain-containing protein [Candidatus Neomarinimicrobiota bacterium]
MKYKRILSIFLIAGIVVFMSSCGDRKGRVSSPPAESVTWVITAGENVFRNLITELSHTLQQAIKNEGIAGAIDMCSVEALPLTQKIADANDQITQIKRTSYQYRNRKNKPDKYEKDALDYFRKFVDTNVSLPSYYVQKIEQKSGDFYRYYKPLTMMPLCLNCHGMVENISPDVMESLKKKYPKDKAIGYSLNDFRGVVSISLSESIQGY